MMAGEHNLQDKRLVQVARLFYQEQLSKSEIASQTQISITHVNRLLKDAQRKGIVEILIKAPRFEDLEAELMRRFNLREVRIIQSVPDTEYLRKELAQTAADYLQSELKNGMKVGVASGRTILETISSLKESPREITIYPLNVSANSETEIKSLSANTIATVLWFKCRPLSKAHQFELFFPNESISDVRRGAHALLARPEAQQLQSEIEKLDMYIIGASELRLGSELVDLSRRCGADYSKLERSGVVGDVAFNTMDTNGKGLPIGLEDLLFHVGLETLRSVSKRRDRSVILVGGGKDKLPAIKAALAGGILNRLVTDSDSAEALLVKSLAA